MNPDATSVIVISRISRVKCFEYFHCQSQIRKYLKPTTFDRGRFARHQFQFSPRYFNKWSCNKCKNRITSLLMESLIVDKIGRLRRFDFSRKKEKKKEEKERYAANFYLPTLINRGIIYRGTSWHPTRMNQRVTLTSLNDDYSTLD